MCNKMSEVAVKNGNHVDVEDYLADLFQYICRLTSDLKSLNEKHENAKGKIEDMDDRIVHLESKEKTLGEKNVLLTQTLQESEVTLKKQEKEIERLTQHLESSSQTSMALTAENNRITEEVFHHKKTLDVLIEEKAEADKLIKNQVLDIMGHQKLADSAGKALSTSVQWTLRYGEVIKKLGMLKGERDLSAMQAYSQFHENLTFRTLSENILISAGISAPFGAFHFDKVVKKDASTSTLLEVPKLVDRSLSPIVISQCPTVPHHITSDSSVESASPVRPSRRRPPLPASPVNRKSQGSPHSSQFMSTRESERSQKTSLEKVGKGKTSSELSYATINMLDNPKDSTLLFSFSVSSLMEVVNVYMDITQVDWVYKDSIVTRSRPNPGRKARSVSSDGSTSPTCSPPRKRMGFQRSPRKKARKSVISEQPGTSSGSPRYLGHRSRSLEQIPLVSLSSEEEFDDMGHGADTMDTHREDAVPSPDKSLEYKKKIILALENLDCLNYNPSQSSKYVEELKDVINIAVATDKVEVAINVSMDFLLSRHNKPLKLLTRNSSVNFMPPDELALLKAYKNLNDLYVLDMLLSKIKGQLSSKLSIHNFAALCRVYAYLKSDMGDCETLQNWCFELFLEHPVVAPFLFANIIRAAAPLWVKLSTETDLAKHPVDVLRYLCSTKPEDFDEDLFSLVRNALLNFFYDASTPDSPSVVADTIVKDFVRRASEEPFSDEDASHYVISFKLLTSRMNWEFIRDEVLAQYLLGFITNCGNYINRKKSSAIAITFKLICVVALKNDHEGYSLGVVRSAISKLKHKRGVTVPVEVYKEAYLAQYYLHLKHHNTKDTDSFNWLVSRGVVLHDDQESSD